MAAEHEEITVRIPAAKLAEWRAGQVDTIRRAEAILLDGYKVLAPTEEDDSEARYSTAGALLHLFVEKFERGEFCKVDR